MENITVSYVALRNLANRPWRTAVLLSGMALMAGSLFLLSSLFVSASMSIQKGADRLGADAVVVSRDALMSQSGFLMSGGQGAAYMDASASDSIKKIQGVKAITGQVFILSSAMACCSVADTTLTGFDPETDFTITPWLERHIGRRLKDDEIIIGSNILSEQGGRLRFFNHVFLIAGKLEPTGMAAIDSAVFVPMSGARKMIESSGIDGGQKLNIKPSDISAVMVKFGEGINHDEAALRIEHATGLKVVTAQDSIMRAKKELYLPLKLTALAGVFQWALTVLYIAVIYGMLIEGRIQEVWVMRAMGASPGVIARMFAYEIVMLSAIGAVLGIAAGAIILYGFIDEIRGLLGSPVLLPTASQAVLICAGAFFITIISGALSAGYSIIRAGRAVA